MPAPIDLSRLRDPVDAKRVLAEMQAAVPGGGVDLSNLAVPRDHKHRWVLVGRFGIDDTTVTRMRLQTLQFAQMSARDEPINMEENPPVPMPMGGENLISTDGPGCAKCGVHWEHPELGYGQGCPASDEDYDAAMATQAEAQNQMRGQNFGRIVEQEKAKMEAKTSAS